MGYDGGFTKIRMKLDTQEKLDNYEINLRESLYDLLGSADFYKFEKLAVELGYLDNAWVQLHCLRDVIDSDNIRNYENDPSHYTLITKDILEKYIQVVKKDYKKQVLEYGENDEEVCCYAHDIEKLESLYNNFNWNNDTLVFSYSY